MKTPPSNGPATDAIPHIPPMRPNAAGRLRSGTVMLATCVILQRWVSLQQYAKMTMAPEKRPPTPIPATALPRIKAMLFGAVAQTKELNESDTWLCKPKK